MSTDPQNTPLHLALRMRLRMEFLDRPRYRSAIQDVLRNPTKLNMLAHHMEDTARFEGKAKLLADPTTPTTGPTGGKRPLIDWIVTHMPEILAFVMKIAAIIIPLLGSGTVPTIPTAKRAKPAKAGRIRRPGGRRHPRGGTPTPTPA